MNGGEQGGPTAVETGALQPEAAKSDAAARAELAAMKPGERVGAFRRAGAKLLKEKVDSGEYSGDDDAIKAQKGRAEEGMQFKNDGTPEDADRFIALVDALSDHDDPAAPGIRDQLASDLVIQVGDGENAKAYTVDEWKDAVKQARESGDSTALALLENKKVGIEAPESSVDVDVEDQAANGNKPQDTEDGEKKEPAMNDVLDEHINTQMGLLSLERKKGGNTKAFEEKIRKLQQARQAEGDAGALFKYRVLQEAGVTNLSQYEEQVGKAVVALKTHLEESTGMTPDEIQKLMQANAGDILKSEQFGKIKGIDQLIFGKPMTSEQIEKIIADKLDPKQRKELAALKKTGDISLILLMILAGGAMLTSEVVKAGSSTQ